MKNGHKGHSDPGKKQIDFNTAMALVFLVLIFGLSIFSRSQHFFTELFTRGAQAVEDYSDDWYLLCGQELRSVRLPFEQNSTGGEKLSIQKEVQSRDWNRSITFLSAYEWVRVYADEKLIYEREGYRTNKRENAPTNGFNYVPIPYGTRKLAIETQSPYAGFGGSFQKIMAGEPGELHLYHQRAYQFHYFVDLLIFIVGMIAVVYGLMLRIRKESSGLSLWLGLSSIALAVWLRTGTVDVEFARLSAGTVMKISYLFWLLLPIMFLQFLQRYLTKAKRGMILFSWLFMGAAAVNVLLRYSGLYDFIEMLWMEHVLLILTLLYLLVHIVKNFRFYWQNKKMGIIGMLFLMGSVFLELMLYYQLNIAQGFFIRVGIALCIGVGELQLQSELRTQKLKEEAAKRKQQLQIAVSQLQPHFIFNTLGAARIMIHTDREKAYDMLYDFSIFFRASLNALLEEKIPFSKELTQIQAYLNIENKRFNGRIRSEYKIEEQDFMIPPLTVESLVLNAVKYGLRKGKDRGTVRVETSRNDNTIRIVVEDDGVGIELSGAFERDEQEPETYFSSIPGIKERLWLVCGGSLQIESEKDKGTRAVIELPVTQMSAADKEEELI